MIPIKMKFEVNFKFYTYLRFFQLDQEQQKNYPKPRDICIFFKTLKFLQFFPKT